MKNYRQLKHIENRRNSISLGRAHQLFIQYQIVRPEDMCTTNIYIEKFVDMYLGIYVCVHVQICI